MWSDEVNQQNQFQIQVQKCNQEVDKRLNVSFKMVLTELKLI